MRRLLGWCVFVWDKSTVQDKWLAEANLNSDYVVKGDEDVKEQIETIKEEVIVKAKNEEDAINMFEDKKNEDPIILSTDTNVEEQ